MSPNVNPPLERFRNVIFALVSLAILGGIVALLSYHPPPAQITIIPPPPTLTPPASMTPGPMKVYVTGAVANPGLVYTLPPGSRVSDAIDAAGGLNDDADSTGVNQAAFVHDGDQLDVPLIRNSSAAAPLPTPSGPVHINAATVDDLRALPGCNASLAAKIIAYRLQNGPFRSLTDLGKVPGVGKVRLSNWQSLLVFD
jgi:competence protein ComEA